MDIDRFNRLLHRMEQSKVVTPSQLVGCSEQEVAVLEARYGLRLPHTYLLYLRLMGHESGRLFTCDHMAVSYSDVLEMTVKQRLCWAECSSEADGGPTQHFTLPDNALLIASRLGDQFEFIRCNGQEDSPVWYFNTWESEVRQSYASVLAWLESWCEEAERAIADGYFETYPEGTIRSQQVKRPEGLSSRGPFEILGAFFEHEQKPEAAMIDTTTQKSLSVSTDGGSGPYIVLPLGQLDKVTALLNANQVSYWVDEEVLSLDGKPEIAFINLGHRIDPVMIQRLLDSIP